METNIADMTITVMAFIVIAIYFTSLDEGEDE